MTINSVCQKCGMPIEKRGPTKYCASCRLLVKREWNKNAYDKRAKEKKEKNVKLTCACCGKRYSWMRKRKYCPECSKMTKAAMKLKMARQEKKKRGRPPKVKPEPQMVDGMIILPSAYDAYRATRYKAEKLPKEPQGKKDSLEHLCWELEMENRRRRANGLPTLSYGRYVTMKAFEEAAKAEKGKE